MTAPDPSAEQTPSVDLALRRAVKSVAISGVVLAVVAALASGLTNAVGVALGGFLATVNLVVFIRLGQAFLARRGGVSWGVIGFVKLFGLFAAFTILVVRTSLSPIALIIGYGALPIGIVASGLFGAKRAER